jgi:signal peptidase I
MRSWLRRHRGYLLFLVLLGVFRTAVADWNPIPSGSMRPTLLEGDLVFVNRLAYDLKVPLTDHSLATLGEPQRGDVVTFSSPVDGTRLIKRLVAFHVPEQYRHAWPPLGLGKALRDMPPLTMDVADKDQILFPCRPLHHGFKSPLLRPAPRPAWKNSRAAHPGCGHCPRHSRVRRGR